MLTTTPASAPRGRVERYDTIVVGGGQAGLATGWHLAARDADFVILDAEARIGDAWRRRWDSLRLFTPAAYSGLPGMCFPAPPAHFPDKDEVADYLERYAERFDLPVRSRTRVERMSWNGERWALRAGSTTFEAENVVVATGPFQRPRIPALAARLAPGIHQLHSSAYRSPLDLPPGDALVVGVGNSGAQIAMELARVRRVWLAGRETGHLPRRVLGRDVFDWLWPVFTRFSAETRIGRRMRERSARGDALVGMPPRDILASGVRRVGRVEEVRDGLPVCDGGALDAGVVLWCTGFAPDYSWIELPILGADGWPRHRRGVAEGVDGLYFVGLRFQHRRSSALIGGVGADAEHVSALVARREARREAA